MNSFDNRHAFVAGAAGGIGRALALELAARGARVTAADIDAGGAADTASRITALGGRAVGVACDITSASSLSAGLDAAGAAFGEIDLTVNAVGVLLSGNPEDIPLSEWERVFTVNVFAAARLIEQVLPGMLARGRGHIVNTASVAGLYPFAMTRVPYAASKAALISLSQNLAINLRPRGVRVSCLCPGPTATAIGATAPAWTENLPVVAPGSDFVLMTAEQTAREFCDGIAAGRVLIVAQEALSLDYVRRWAASPDKFAFEKIGQYACGELGLPVIDFDDPAIVAALTGTAARGEP